MKKFVNLIIVVVAVSIIVGLYADVSKGSTDSVQAQDPLPPDWPDIPGVMPPLLDGKKADRPYVFIEKTDNVEPQSIEATTFDVWYGDVQNFGDPGKPQQWVNVLGNVQAPGGVKSLVFSLNGGPDQSLSIGLGTPQNSRLVNDGDFNIEIDYANLNSGANTVEIKATDNNDDVTTKNVTVNYTPGKSWPESYDVAWVNDQALLEKAQVVDGKWDVVGGKLVIDGNNAGYDRLVSIGDVGDAASNIWTEYEVTVPIIVTGVDPSATFGTGIGLILRWQGQTAYAAEQPRLNWDRSGAVGWYSWASDGTEGLRLFGKTWRKPTNTDKVWDFGQEYILKMSVQNVPNSTTAYYRLKFWKKGQDEPGEWGIEGLSAQNNSPSGSVLLVAHNVEAKFGAVKIRPLDEVNPTLAAKANGSGTINVVPVKPEYAYAESVTIAATAGTNAYLESWSGSVSKPGFNPLTGTFDPLKPSMTSNMKITANFKDANPGSLTVEIDGQGEVLRDPDKETYAGGEVVKLTAVPAPGNIFAGWGIGLSGIVSPAWSLIDGDRTVKATFVKPEDTTPFTDQFNTCELDTDIWTFVDPTAVGSVEQSEGRVRISVPGGAAHTMWDSNQDALRIMQDTEDQDFTVEVKFDSIPVDSLQIEGILVEQDQDNWLRFDFYRTNSNNLLMFAGGTIDGNPMSESNSPVSGVPTDAIYMRVSRLGDMWSHTYSLDGENWQAPNEFSQALTVNSIGIFAGNEPDGTAPAFTLVADYFKNVSFPNSGSGYQLVYNVAGEGTVQIDPQPDENGRYSCNTEVTVEAFPADKFTAWSGDLSGSQNPAILIMNEDKEITAVFSSKVYLPAIIQQ